MSTDGKSKSSPPEDCMMFDKPTALAAGITIHDKKWTDGSIPLDSVPSSLAKLGKVGRFSHLSSAHYELLKFLVLHMFAITLGGNPKKGDCCYCCS